MLTAFRALLMVMGIIFATFSLTSVANAAARQIPGVCGIPTQVVPLFDEEFFVARGPGRFVSEGALTAEKSYLEGSVIPQLVTMMYEERSARGKFPHHVSVHVVLGRHGIMFPIYPVVSGGKITAVNVGRPGRYSHTDAKLGPIAIIFYSTAKTDYASYLLQNVGSGNRLVLENGCVKLHRPKTTKMASRG